MASSTGSGGVKKASEYKQAYLVCKQTPTYAKVEPIRSGVNLTNNAPNYGCSLIAPANTNINFAGKLSVESFTTARKGSALKLDESTGAIVVPPLNTNIHFSSVLPTYVPSMTLLGAILNPAEHPHAPHVHDVNAENFSWAVSTTADSAEIAARKKLIHPVQNQELCGSCWAVSMASVMSDCLVVGGAVDWAPSLSATYIMACLPNLPEVQQQCNGGNPAQVAVALEKTAVCDNSCMDYSWCTNDAQVCTSAAAAQHFQAQLGDKLNTEIPTPCGCYFAGERYAYTLDGGSTAWNIESAGNDINVFRKSAFANIVDFGPIVGGYAVLQNFISGNNTNPDFNGGVYIDRADYSIANAISFDDANATSDKVVGLHAVAVMGWGVAKNIQYDTGKRGDVPFWHCRNSWGEGWGSAGGYFKMAMYPFNKVSQFCTQIWGAGGPSGSMMMIRATKPPRKMSMPAISDESSSRITRVESDSFYKQTPEQFAESRRRLPIPPSLPGATAFGTLLESTSVSVSLMIVAVGVAVLLILLAVKMCCRGKRRGGGVPTGRLIEI